MVKIKIKRKKVQKGEKIIPEEKDTVIPIRGGTGILAVILRENKSCTWKWLPYDFEHFQVGKHTYFKEPKGTYLSENNILLAIYIEGISIPVSHQYIKKKMEERTYVDTFGERKTVSVPVIQNIKFDSEVVDMLLNRNLADEFLKEPPSGMIMIVLIFVVITLAMSIVNIGLKFL